MKKTIRKITALLLSALILLTGFAAFADSSITKGSVITIGSYPSERVYDTSLKASLAEELDENGWTSFEFLINQNADYTKSFNEIISTTDSESSSCIEYQDIELDGVMFRALKFNSGRPLLTALGEETSLYCGTSNGIEFYEFKPLSWEILDADTGLAMCTGIIDSQAFSDTLYFDTETENFFVDPDFACSANDFMSSSIFAFVNDVFYVTALKNSGYASALKEMNDVYRVSIPSVELLEKTEIEASFTNYAEAIGLDLKEYSVNGAPAFRPVYWLSDGIGEDELSCFACAATNDNELFFSGSENSTANLVNNTSYGVRPIITIDLEAYEEIFTQLAEAEEAAQQNVPENEPEDDGIVIEGEENVGNPIVPKTSDNTNVTDGYSYTGFDRNTTAKVKVAGEGGEKISSLIELFTQLFVKVLLGIFKIK